MCGIRNDTNELIYKTETDLQTEKTNLQLPKGKGQGGMSGVWDQQMQTTIHKIDKK